MKSLILSIAVILTFMVNPEGSSQAKHSRNVEIDLCKIGSFQKRKRATKILKNTQSVVFEMKDNPDSEACIFGLVDSLANSVIIYGHEKSLQALDSLMGYGDGYIGEYYTEIGLRLFKEASQTLAIYLLDRPDSNVEKEVFYGLSLDCAMTIENTEMSVAEYQEQLLDSLNSNNLSNHEMQYLKKIVNEIDPSIWE